MPGSRDVELYLRGAAYGLAAVSIWAGWIVVARLGLRSSLTPWDIAALRFGVAGLLLLPLVLAKGLALDRLGWGGLAAIVLGGAAPVFLANTGLLFAPAAHAGALFPGVMPLLVALLAAVVLHDEITGIKKLGFALMLPGVLAITLGSGGELGSMQNLGHALFLCAGLAWAFYTVALRRAHGDMQVATSWSAADTGIPALTFDGNGGVTNTWQYDPGNSGDQRSLGPHHHKVDLLILAERDHRLVVGEVERDAFRLLRNAGIARRAIKLVRQRARGDRPGERVLAAAGTENEDVHETRRRPLGTGCGLV